MHKKYTCPHCGHERTWAVRDRGRKCRKCRREWTVRSAYPVQGFRLTKREWRQVLDTYLRDGTGTALVCECGTNHTTAYRITRCIQEVMARDAPERLSHIIEVDATFVGGDWKNKRIHIRRKGTKRGRGTSKQAIFGIMQRSPNRVRVFLVASEGTDVTRTHIVSLVPRGSRIYSDECPAYASLPEAGYRHEAVDHSKNEYVRGDVHTQTLDGFWGRLKNFLASKGGVRRTELHRFIAEQVWRYNHRSLARSEQVRRLFSLLKEG